MKALWEVVSSGMALALEKRKLLHVFDALYVSSAGAFNGAHFPAHQANFIRTITIWLLGS